MMSDETLMVGDVDDDLDGVLADEIYAFNVAATGLNDGRLLRIAVREDEGGLVAGLSGWTWGGAGYVDRLWVRADQRGKGWGRRLLRAAEEEMVSRGCDRVALNTHSFQAPRFYASAGYVECGRTPGYPHGHDQIHLVKRIG
jgi:GNAT superfamily N-acetyltransferase